LICIKGAIRSFGVYAWKFLCIFDNVRTPPARKPEERARLKTEISPIAGSARGEAVMNKMLVAVFDSESTGWTE